MKIARLQVTIVNKLCMVWYYFHFNLYQLNGRMHMIDRSMIYLIIKLIHNIVYKHLPDRITQFCLILYTVFGTCRVK